MDTATIGDGVRPVYAFDWGDRVRTSREIGDLAAAGVSADLEDVVAVARDDPECEVRVIGFE